MAPFQLGILNPLAFALMEWGGADAADAAAAAAAVAVACTSSCTSSASSATAALLPADACAAAAAATSPRRVSRASRASRASRVRRVLRRVLRSPLVASVLGGLAVRLGLWLIGPEAALPAAVQGIFQPLQVRGEEWG